MKLVGFIDFQTPENAQFGGKTYNKPHIFQTNGRPNLRVYQTCAGLPVVATKSAKIQLSTSLHFDNHVVGRKINK